MNIFFQFSYFIGFGIRYSSHEYWRLYSVELPFIGIHLTIRREYVEPEDDSESESEIENRRRA